MKRVFDLLVSLGAVLLTAPAMLIIACVLKLTGEHRVLFRQERIGLQGRPFNLLKFATMRSAALARPDAGITLDDDPDVFPFGRTLRRTKLNELPQLFNVLRGEMSVVGPRPLPARSMARYSEQVRNEIVQLKPGLTGLGSLLFRDEEAIIARSSKTREQCYTEDIRPRKAELELIYKKNISLWLDLKLVTATAVAVLMPSINVGSLFFGKLIAQREKGGT